MSRTQHLAGAFAALLTVLPASIAAQNAQIPGAAQIVRLVKASAQLTINGTIFSTAFDAQTHPYVAIRSAPEGTVGGYLVPEAAHADRLSDGTLVLIVPLESGGSGGVFTQILFSGRDEATLAYLGYIDSGGHLDVEVDNGVIVASMPYYGDDSPNCCPKERIVQTYMIRHGALVKLSEKRAPIPKGE